jgi:oligopeptidase B
VIPTADLNSKPQVVLERKQGVEYSVSIGEGCFWIRTNENAQNFRVYSLQAGKKEVLIPHDKNVFIQSINVFSQRLVLRIRRDGLPGVLVVNLETKEIRELEFPDPVYEVSSSVNPNFDASEYRLAYSSPVTPNTTFAFSFDTYQRRTLKIAPVKGGYNSTEYTCRRIWAEARDGAMVPVSVVFRKDQSNGGSPTLLYGYGSYGYSYPVGFRSSWISLLDRGLTIAIAHIRGGSEMGRHWYENGKFFNKLNSFTDFVDAADHLVREGVAKREKLVITGGSAGGLLMGAVLNLRPDLCQACVARVPFVDVVNTMCDANLPLTVIEYEEWGDPNKRDVFEYMLSYSPYDNVEAKDYPNIMVTAGLNDPRVGYWEPSKWVARLRDTKTDDNKLILRTHMGAGHSGASGRYGYLEDTAWMFAFVIDQVSS